MPAKAATKARAAKTRAGARQQARWHSRAVVRLIEPGNDAYCQLCDQRVKFQARLKHRQVICNVYVRGVWNRVEHYHEECYESAGHPHGEVAAA